MEKAAADGEVAVVRGTFDWSDVGSWQAVAGADRGRRRRQPRPGRARRDRHARHVRPRRGSRRRDRRRREPGHRRHARCRAGRASRSPAAREGSRRRAEGARPRGVQAAPTVARPWGAYTVLEEGPGFKIKRIEVKPGAALSLQLHHRRSEHWVVVRGIARVTRGDDVFDLRANESTFIPVETRHRLENPRHRAARDHRGAVRRLPRRGRHRPLRRQVRPRASIARTRRPLIDWLDRGPPEPPTARAPARHRDAGQDQRDAGEVERAQPLVQEQPREDDAEHRHQVDEQSGHLAPDLLDAAVPEDVREHRREQRRRASAANACHVQIDRSSERRSRRDRTAARTSSPTHAITNRNDSMSRPGGRQRRQIV